MRSVTQFLCHIAICNLFALTISQTSSNPIISPSRTCKENKFLVISSNENVTVCSAVPAINASVMNTTTEGFELMTKLCGGNLNEAKNITCSVQQLCTASLTEFSKPASAENSKCVGSLAEACRRLLSEDKNSIRQFDKLTHNQSICVNVCALPSVSRQTSPSCDVSDVLLTVLQFAITSAESFRPNTTDSHFITSSSSIVSHAPNTTNTGEKLSKSPPEDAGQSKADPEALLTENKPKVTDNLSSERGNVSETVTQPANQLGESEIIKPVKLPSTAGPETQVSQVSDSKKLPPNSSFPSSEKSKLPPNLDNNLTNIGLIEKENKVEDSTKSVGKASAKYEDLSQEDDSPDLVNTEGKDGDGDEDGFPEESPVMTDVNLDRNLKTQYDKDSEKQSIPYFLPPDEDSNSGYFGYFVSLIGFIGICFLLFHNKKRLIALLLEGRRPNGGRRRSVSGSGTIYRKLENNFD